jgi:hypothetical protein
MFSNAFYRGISFKNKYLEFFQDKPYNLRNEVEAYSLYSIRQIYNLFLKLRGIFKDIFDTENLELEDLRKEFVNIHVHNT